MTGIRVIGLDKIQAALRADLEPALTQALLGITKEVEHRLAQYPAATAANSPSNPTGRWYERGFGPRWIRRRDGAVRGRRTSQTLGRRWATRVEILRVTLANLASYAAFVHSHDRQNRFHRARGWRTDRDALEQVVAAGLVQRLIGDALARAYGGLLRRAR